MRRVAPARESPLVGRRQELATLDSLYERVVRERHLPPRDGRGRGRRGQVAPAARVRGARCQSTNPQPTVRTGRCLPYGSGIVFWALGEVLREECGIVESDSSEEAWGKLRAYVAELIGRRSAKVSDREAALIGRLLGVDVPPELVPTRTTRSACARRSSRHCARGIEAIASRQPFVIAFEDIHWADDGMLDAIEHLAQWVRAPLMLVCLARDELLDRRPGWGGGRRSATQLLLDPLSDEHSRALVRALLPEGEEVVPAVAERSGGNPLFAEEMARRIAEEGTIEAAELPDTVQAVLAARLDSLEPFERRLVQQASVVGRTFPEGALAALATPEGRDLGRALIVAPGEGHPRPRRRGPAGRRARAGLQARADPRRGLRDAPQGGPLAEALRGGRLPRGARRRPHRRGAWRCSPSTTAARRRSAARAALAPQELEPMRERALRFLEEAGDAAAHLYANREAAAHYRHARDDRLRRTGAPTWCGSARSSATCRCAWAGSTRRSACGRTASTGTAARRTSSAWPTCTARSAPRYRTRASARPRSSTTRRASTC